MNTSELEQRMKQLLEEQEYTPAEASWEKMHQALHPPSSKRNLLLLMLPGWKVAAAVGLVLSTGLGAYLFLKEEKEIEPPIVAQHETKQQKPAANPADATPQIPESSSETVAHTAQPAIAATRILQKRPTNDTATLAPAVIAQQAVFPDAPQVVKEQTSAPDNLALQQQDKGTSSGTQRSYSPVFQNPQPQYEKRNINLGLAANIGKPSLGNVQYNVGIVARKDLTSRIFAEANVSLASTQVNYTEQIASESALSGFGDLFTESSNPPKEIILNYSSNVIAVGVAPVIGVKATRNLSVSVGGDVYKTLNRNLDFKNSPNETLKNPSVTPPGKVVTDWDAGLKAQLDYRLGERLSMNTQYRQGLTQYIISQNNKSIRNSIFNIGFKYYIGK